MEEKYINCNIPDLKVGDIVKHRAAFSEPYIVTANYGDRVTAVRTVDITNALEWEHLPLNKTT